MNLTLNTTCQTRNLLLSRVHEEVMACLDILMLKAAAGLFSQSGCRHRSGTLGC